MLAVGTEADINELEDYEERKMFLEDITQLTRFILAFIINHKGEEIFL